MGRGRHGDRGREARPYADAGGNHAHCAANLARFKCPRLIEFVDALPRNATGKIHKPTLRQKFNATKATDRVAS
jgi:acyl-CoA synthetase (AMP-forming)/AMP-acid ligase II